MRKNNWFVAALCVCALAAFSVIGHAQRARVNGGYVVPAHSAFGANATIDANSTSTVLNLFENYTGSETGKLIYGAQLYQAFQGTVDNTGGQVYGTAITGIANGTKNIDAVYGAYVDAHSNGTGTPTTLTGVAGYGINYNSGSTITSVAGGSFGAQNHAVARTITNAYGLDVLQLGFWSDTPVTNAYGVRIGSPTCFDAGCTTTSIRGLRIDDQTLGATATQYAIDVNGKFLVGPDGGYSAVTEVAFASLPSTRPVGALANVSDSNTNVWGANVAGGGANHILARWNGTNWTVVGK